MTSQENCPACKNPIVSEEVCLTCKFPFKGTETEKSLHIGRYISERGVVGDSSNAVAKSQKIIFLLCVFNALFIIVGIANATMDIWDIGFNIVLTVLFLFCGFFIKKNPVLMTFATLLLYSFIILLNYFVEPQSVFNGFFFKIFFIGSLSYCIYLLRGANRFKKKYKIQ